MKKIIVKVVIGAVGAFILVIGGILAKASVWTYIGMQETHGEEKATDMLKNYMEIGAEKLKIK